MSESIEISECRARECGAGGPPGSRRVFQAVVVPLVTYFRCAERSQREERLPILDSDLLGR
jgi:hypothetical protein